MTARKVRTRKIHALDTAMRGVGTATRYPKHTYREVQGIRKRLVHAAGVRGNRGDTGDGRHGNDGNHTLGGTTLVLEVSVVNIRGGGETRNQHIPSSCHTYRNKRAPTHGHQHGPPNPPHTYTCTSTPGGPHSPNGLSLKDEHPGTPSPSQHGVPPLLQDTLQPHGSRRGHGTHGGQGGSRGQRNRSEGRGRRRCRV
jgi:hypothetical protein